MAHAGELTKREVEPMQHMVILTKQFTLLNDRVGELVNGGLATVEVVPNMFTHKWGRFHFLDVL